MSAKSLHYDPKTFAPAVRKSPRGGPFFARLAAREAVNRLSLVRGATIDAPRDGRLAAAAKSVPSEVIL